MASQEYIDYETFLSPGFKSSAFANKLLLATNNANDVPLDLATPLSRVLFDSQEIDSHIDALATKSAIPLLTHAKIQADASGRILANLDSQISPLNYSYAQLERDVIQKHAEAEQVRHVALRLWKCLKLARSITRCLQLGRQLQVQLADAKEDHVALMRSAHTLFAMREIFKHSAPSEEGCNLDRIAVIQTLERQVLSPGHESVQKAAETIIRNFSVPEAEDTRAREVSAALCALYLMSPAPWRNERWSPVLMLQAVELNLRGALQTSIAALGRGLGQFNGQMPMLEKSLAEVSSNCRTIIHLEMILESTKAPEFPLLGEEQQRQVAERDKGNLLQPLLNYLETLSLASYFWRTLASSLSTRVQEMSQRGGSAARFLRLAKKEVENSIRKCVLKGSEIIVTNVRATATDALDKKQAPLSWDREVAVMVGSVVNNLGG